VRSGDHDNFRKGVRLIGRALGVPEEQVEAALAPLRRAVRDDDGEALAVVRRALIERGVSITGVFPGRPTILELEASQPVAFGEGVVVGDLLDDATFRPWVLNPGRRVRAALYRSAKRMAGLAMFSTRPPTERAPWDGAFLVLESEARVWQINGAELAFVRDELESGRAWHRIRLLANGTLRMELPMSGSDWDFSFRVGKPPTRRRKR
jgi:hypothetical protein